MKMSRSDRAKIFSPFSPLKGLSEALREKERLIENKPELSEDRLEELDRVILSLKDGDRVFVIFYTPDGYERITGEVRLSDDVKDGIYVDERKIELTNIYDLCVF